jgi:hypothetical protein
MTQHCDCRDCSPEPERICEACEEGDHARCSMSVHCECDCDPEAAMIEAADPDDVGDYFGGEWTDDSYFWE